MATSGYTEKVKVTRQSKVTNRTLPTHLLRLWYAFKLIKIRFCSKLLLEVKDIAYLQPGAAFKCPVYSSGLAISKTLLA